MVDRDKIKKRSGGDDEDEDSGSSSSTVKRGGSGSESKGGEPRVSDDAKSDTYADKIEQFKGNTGGENAHGPVKNLHFGKAVSCLVNIIIYAENEAKELENEDGRRAGIEYSVANNCYEQFERMSSELNVQAICEKFGLDWVDDVVSEVIMEQDFEKLEKDPSTNHSPVKVNTSQDIDMEFYREILIAISDCYHYSKVAESYLDITDDKARQMASEEMDKIESEVLNFMGVFNIRNACEEYGMKWDQDIYNL